MTKHRKHRQHNCKNPSASLALLLVVWVGPRSALGQEKPPPPPSSSSSVQEGRTRFNRGLQAAKDGNYAAALVEFRRAYDVAPNFRVLYNLAQTYAELQNHAQALQTFERYLREGDKEIVATRRQEVTNELEKLRTKVGFITVIVNREQADVYVDDVLIGKSPVLTPVLVNVGRHTISANLLGTVSATRQYEIASGDRAEVTLALQDIPTIAPKVTPAPPTVAIAVSAPPPPAPPPPARRGFSPGVIALGAVGAGAVGVFAYFAISGTNDRNNLQATCAPRCAPNDVDAARRKLILGDVFLGVGAAALGTATFLFFSRPSPEPVRAGSVQIHPLPGGAFASWGKHF